MSRKGVNYRKILTRKISRSKPCYVLDAGTGAGNMTKALSDDLNSSIITVDLNRQVFHHASDTVARVKVDFVVCDFVSLPFKDQAFGAIVCDLVISTSGEWKPLDVLREFKRTLKANSRLYITDYYPDETATSKQDKLAAETSKLFKEVMEIKGTPLPTVPPEVTVQALKDIGLTKVRLSRIVANEKLEWKKKVFEEYYQGMERQISTVTDREIQESYRKKLENIRKEIMIDGEPRNWGWGANYMIQAST